MLSSTQKLGYFVLVVVNPKQNIRREGSNVDVFTQISPVTFSPWKKGTKTGPHVQHPNLPILANNPQPCERQRQWNLPSQWTSPFFGGNITECFITHLKSQKQVADKPNVLLRHFIVGGVDLLFFLWKY